MTVPVIILSEKDLKVIIDEWPYEEANDVKKKYFTFLKSPPSSELIEAFNLLNFSPDKFLITDKVIYVNYELSLNKSKLTNSIIEKKLRVNATTRNWNTTHKLLEMSNKLAI